MANSVPAASLIPTDWRRNSTLFLVSQFATGVTSMVVQYAIVWYLTQKSGSATILSVATLLAMLPMVLVSPFVGTFVDRWNKKALLIVPDIVAAGVAIVLSVVGTVNAGFPLWLVFVSLTVRSLAQAFQMPTVQSILPTMVPPKELTKVNGRLGMVQSATMIISPALGAFLYALIPINLLILTDVLGAALGISLLSVVRILSHAAQTTAGPRIWADMVFGLTRIRTAPGMWTLLIISALFTLMFMPAGSMYPLMTLGYFHGTVMQAGIVEVVWSVGSLAGSALIGMYGKWRNRMKPTIAGIAALGAAFALCALLPPTPTGFVGFVALNALAGTAVAFPSTLPMAMIQQSFPAEELGRVFGVCMAIIGLAGPLGLLLAGPLGDALGVEWVFLISGVGALLCAATAVALPSARGYDLRLQKRVATHPSAETSAESDEISAV